MDSWIFRIDKDSKVIIDKDALSLSTELSKLTDKELRYVILVEDYVKSILRRKPKSERMRNAGSMVFSNEEYKPTEKVLKAMVAYHSLLYETKRETVDSLLSKISQINASLMRQDISDREFKSLMALIDMAEKKIEELNKKIDEDDQEEQLKLKGGKKLSRIEQWQRNQRKYNEHRKQIQI